MNFVCDTLDVVMMENMEKLHLQSWKVLKYNFWHNQVHDCVDSLII